MFPCIHTDYSNKNEYNLREELFPSVLYDSESKAYSMIHTIKKLIFIHPILKRAESYPQCTVIDSFILKVSFLCSKDGCPPNTEPPLDSLKVESSSEKYVKFFSTGDTDGVDGMRDIACSTGM